jgi:dipeptidyl-peptidase-4
MRRLREGSLVASLLGMTQLFLPGRLLAFPSPPALTPEWIVSEEADSVGRVPRAAWTSAGEVLLLDDLAPASGRTLEIVDAATGARRRAFEPRAALEELRRLGASPVPDALPWPDSLDAAGTKGAYLFGGDVYLLDVRTGRVERLTATPEPESIPRLSPDGRRVAFVRGRDLWVLDLASRTETRLTRDGGDTILNGVPSFIYWEEILHHADAAYWWSDDSRSIAFLRSDDSPVDEELFTSFRPAVPDVIAQRYPRAGRPSPIVTLGVADAASGRTSWMKTSSAYEWILGVTWSPDGERVAVQTTNRAQDRLDLWSVSAEDGATSLVLTEDDPAWVNQKEVRFLPGGELLVSSERTGRTHLYRHAADGKPMNAVTRGEWSVRGPGAFYAAPVGSAWPDPANGRVYFTSREASPLQRQLYRVGLDGSAMVRVSREPGIHTIRFSPDLRFYLDQHSSHDTPPSLTLRRADGSSIAVLSPPRRRILEPLRLHPPELITIPASDGYPLAARITWPRSFDSTARHPVILRVYGGPGVPIVQDDWDRGVLFDQLLGQRGYVVVSVDPRIATAASKKIEEVALKNLWSDAALGDLVDAVRWLKTQSWADPGRFGIWGRSGGGAFTLVALTRSEEFAAGISVAPVTDWRFYDSKATEAYMKTPEENPEGYERAAVVPRAKDLHGRLLLAFGTYDDNVHPQNEWAFIDALVAAGKPFDLMLYPGRKHGIDDRAARRHLMQTMVEFWRRWLSRE